MILSTNISLNVLNNILYKKKRLKTNVPYAKKTKAITTARLATIKYARNAMSK